MWAVMRFAPCPAALAWVTSGQDDLLVVMWQYVLLQCSLQAPIHSLSLGREDTLTPTPTASEGVLRCRHPAMLSCPGSQRSAINSFCVT